MILPSLLLIFPFVSGANNIRIQRDYRYPKYSGFPIFWNVPTFMCNKYGMDFSQYMSKWGIIANANDTFRGKYVSILYDPGEFPALLKSSRGTLVERNNAIPQLGNLTRHLDRFEAVVEQLMPKDFEGVGIIDFEAYRVIFRQNWNEQVAYLDRSRELEMQKHPQWSKDQIEDSAATNFEAASRIFFESTLKLARLLRPNGEWGYYGYPYCYNYRDNSGMVPWCNRDVVGENDRINWLWSASNGIFPSLYLSEDLDRKNRVNYWIGRMNEAFRVATKFGGRKIPAVHPYVWSKYTDTSNYLTPDDMYNVIETIRRYQVGGVILWGSSNDFTSEDKCKSFLNYLNKVLGPAIVRARKNSNRKNYFVSYNGASDADITGNTDTMDLDDTNNSEDDSLQFVPIGNSVPSIIYTAVGNNETKSIFQYDTVPDPSSPLSGANNITFENTTKQPSKRDCFSKSPYIDPKSVGKDLPLLKILVNRYNRFVRSMLNNV